MELTDADLCKRPEKLEFQELQKYTFSPASMSALETLLLDVYAALRPTKIDYEHRINLVHVFDSMAKENCGCSGDFPIMEAFGSFVMDLFTAKSDLDLSVNFSADDTASFPREMQISVLRKFAKLLYAQQRKGKMSGVLPILRARVPVLKVMHRGTGIQCDISVENKDGISRSLIINLMCLVDERFRMLSFLMKVWAKAHDINSTKDHTLSSLSIILLVAFHLQTRDPPILPPFSALLRDGRHPVSVEKIVHEFKDFGAANKESVAELLITLLSKLSSVRSLWELGLCASTYEGCWISKPWQTANIGVEDFLDQSQNCARAVGKVELPIIYSCIDSSISHLVQFMNGQVEGSDLRILLFGPTSLHTRDEGVPLNGSSIPKNQKKVRKIPSNDIVAAPGNTRRIPYARDEGLFNGSNIPIKQEKKRKVASDDSVAAPVNTKRIHPTGTSDQLRSQIPGATPVYHKHSVVAPDEAKKIHYTARSDQLGSQISSATTVYLKHFTPPYHQSIPRQLSFRAPDHPKPHSSERYNLPHLNPQQSLLSSPASAAYRPHHPPGAPFNVHQLAYGGHGSSPFVAPPNLAYGPEHHYPRRPPVPPGLQSDDPQTRPPLISRELHYKPFLGTQTPPIWFSRLDFGPHPKNPMMPSGDGHHPLPHLGYHNRIPGQPARPFYRG